MGPQCGSHPVTAFKGKRFLSSISELVSRFYRLAPKADQPIRQSARAVGDPESLLEAAALKSRAIAVAMEGGVAAFLREKRL